MADIKIEEILGISRSRYSELFRDPRFGLGIAKHLASKHSLPGDISRKTEGSSLVFEVGKELFLKATPPFFADSFDVELAANQLVASRLTVRTPEILFHGEIENWKYLVSKRVPGIQAALVYRDLSRADLDSVATDLGALIKSYRAVDTGSFEGSFGTWKAYLDERLKNQRSVHLAKGNSLEWVDKICSFVASLASDLVALGPARLIHADLNREHIMLDQIGGRYRVVGLLDLADSMMAPMELEYVLPFLDVFRGSSVLQRRVMNESGFKEKIEPDRFSKLLLALTLQNRFMAFHDWFQPELKSGATTLEEIAFKSFPPH
jgi:hygromycin-B 7''-O-kinase